MLQAREPKKFEPATTQGTLQLTNTLPSLNWVLVDNSVVNSISQGADEDQRSGFSMVTKGFRLQLYMKPNYLNNTPNAYLI